MANLIGLPGGAPYRPSVIKFSGYDAGERYAPMQAGERGIILWSGMQVDPSGRSISGCPLGAADLRAALLLNDKIDWPWNDWIAASYTPDELFLRNEGILRRSIFTVDGSDILGSILRTNLLALDSALAADPGRWAVGRAPGQDASFPIGALDNHGILVRLNECIPIPNKDVPFDEILTFKQRREPELRALQYHIDQIYQTILSAPDIQRARIAEIDALDRALTDHVKAINEAPFKKVLSGLEANIDVGKAAWAAFATIGAFNAGLPLTTELGLGACSLTLAVGLGRKDKGRTDRPFEYVTKFYRELF